MPRLHGTGGQRAVPNFSEVCRELADSSVEQLGAEGGGSRQNTLLGGNVEQRWESDTWLGRACTSSDLPVSLGWARLHQANAVLRVPGEVFLPVLPRERPDGHPQPHPAQVGLQQVLREQLLQGPAEQDLERPTLQRAGYQSCPVQESEVSQPSVGKTLPVPLCVGLGWGGWLPVVKMCWSSWGEADISGFEA